MPFAAHNVEARIFTPSGPKKERACRCHPSSYGCADRATGTFYKKQAGHVLAKLLVSFSYLTIKYSTQCVIYSVALCLAKKQLQLLFACVGYFSLQSYTPHRTQKDF